MKARRHLLVVTRFNPLNGVSGTGTYVCSIFEYLRRNGIRVTLCWSERPEAAARRGWWLVPKDTAAVATLLMPGALCLGRLRVFPGVWTGPLKASIRRWGKAALVALGLRKPSQPAAPEPTAAPENPYRWDRPPDPYEFEFFGNAVARLRPDAVLFNFCWMTPIAALLPDGPRTFTLTHDLRHLYSTLVEGKIRHTEGELMTKALETDYLRQTAVAVAIREDDAETFREMLPEKVVLTALPSIAPRPSKGNKGRPVPGRCLFVAAANVANQEGIEWFLREAWPQVRAAHPAAEVHLCGSLCQTLPPETWELPGVVRRGFVADLDAAYDEAAVVIVPLLRGSGVKIKLMEALAHGKACVSTPIGTEGVPALEDSLRVAGTAGEFAAHVAELLADDVAREALETSALETVRARFSPEICYRPLLKELLR